jgi:hypothetical protein
MRILKKSWNCLGGYISISNGTNFCSLEPVAPINLYHQILQKVTKALKDIDIIYIAAHIRLIHHRLKGKRTLFTVALVFQ